MLKCTIDSGAGIVEFAGSPKRIAEDVMSLLSTLLDAAEKQGLLDELLLHLIAEICSEDNPVARRYSERHPAAAVCS